MEDELENETGEQPENSKVPKQLLPHVYKKGQSGNPSGRPEGISMKEYIRKNFRHMTDAERETFLEGINKIELFKMAEGNPDNKTDITTKGDKIELTPKTKALTSKFEEELKQGL